MDQRTPEWFKARLGIPTASCFDKIVTKSGAPSDSRYGYMGQLICERIFRRRFDDFAGNKWTRHGVKFEDEAAAMFEFAGGFKTEPVGFVPSACGRWGCSPDRLIVGMNAAVEIKCPSPWRHMEYWINGPGKDYKQQVQGQMLCGGYDKVYFFTYFPGMMCKYFEYKRDDKFINSMEEILSEFSKTLDEQTKKVEEFYNYKNFDNYTRVLEIISELMPQEE